MSHCVQLDKFFIEICMGIIFSERGFAFSPSVSRSAWWHRSWSDFGLSAFFLRSLVLLGPLSPRIQILCAQGRNMLLRYLLRNIKWLLCAWLSGVWFSVYEISMFRVQERKSSGGWVCHSVPSFRGFWLLKTWLLWLLPSESSSPSSFAGCIYTMAILRRMTCLNSYR